MGGDGVVKPCERELAHVGENEAYESTRICWQLVIRLAEFGIPLYDADLESRSTPAGVLQLKALLHDHPAWLIASPEYNGSYTGLLKNTIDWCSSPVKSDPNWADGLKPFRGKVAGVMSASPGALGGLRSLSHLTPLLMNLHMWVCPQVYALGKAADAFDAQGGLIGEAAQKGVRAVVEQSLWAAQRLT
jgi:chromate reductase, NAD(P)H dehydrogenase (quinone)